MKVAVECQSPLLQKSLELFLEHHLVSKKHCEILIKDTLPLEGSEDDSRSFYIGNAEKVNLIKPFSKSQLILALEKLEQKEQKEIKSQTEEGKPMGFEILEKRIEMLTNEYQQNIINAVRAFYEN